MQNKNDEIFNDVGPRQDGPQRPVAAQRSVSVITVVLNSEKHLNETIKSVGAQTYDLVEYIVVDGGSKDGTIEIIKGHSRIIDRWISEKDRGVFDGMNKGIRMAQGDYCVFMNAGDHFYNEGTLASFMQGNSAANDIIYGDVVIRHSSHDYYLKAKPTKELIYGMIASHQSMIIKTQLLRTHPYDISYKYAADFDFALKMYRMGKTFVYIPQPMSYYMAGGLSVQQRIKRDLEVFRTIIRNAPRYSWMAYFWQIKRVGISVLMQAVSRLLPENAIDYIKRIIRT